MQRIFIDTDVIFDFLLDRKPFSEHSAIILTLSENHEIRACVSALTFANYYYILKKFSSHNYVINKLSQLAEMVDIIDVTKESIIASLKSDFKDFEDSIQNETAKMDKQIKVLVTRNVKDYRKSELSIISPEAFLKSLPK